MDLAKAKRFNQGLDADGVALVARARKLTPAQVATWGATVLAGVASWQARNGLTADGMVGPKTATKMAASEGDVGAQRVVGRDLDLAALQFPDHRFGIDISYYQPNIEPAKIYKAGCRFAVLRLGQRKNLDSKVESHKAALQAVGIKAWSYYLGQQIVDGVKTDPKAYARFAADHHVRIGVWNGGGELDLEPDSAGKPPRFYEAAVDAWGRKPAAEWVRVWLEESEDIIGTVAPVYLSLAIARAGGDELRAAVGNRPVHWALYQAEPMLPRRASPGAKEGWDRWDLWQFRADDRPTIAGGRCPGVMNGTKACDLNVVNPASPLTALFGA